MTRRGLVPLVGDILDACDAAADLVMRGRAAYDEDRMLRLASEALLGRIGDASQKLEQRAGEPLPAEIPWRDVVGQRIVVDHHYHDLDYTKVWETLEQDVPTLRRELYTWADERDLVHAYFK